MPQITIRQDWVEPLHPRVAVDRAGRALLEPSCTAAERDHALGAVNNWRSAHAFPLNSMQMVLRQRADRVDDYSWISQRLKRLPAIIVKLERFGTMNLSQVQDIAGCRAVVSSIGRVRRLKKAYLDGVSQHTWHHTKDYLETPPASGYRGVHLVYRFRSPIRPAFDGLFVEVQLRSYIQHAWATAVETVDFFQRQQLKTGGGNAEWKRFFALMGTALAVQEKTARVPGTPSDDRAVEDELRALAISLDVRRRLDSYRRALAPIIRPSTKGAGSFLLVLTPSRSGHRHELRVRGYPKGQDERAAADYFRYEKRSRGVRGSEVVLVRVDSLAELRKAYPNYFLNTTLFLRLIASVLGPPKLWRPAQSR